MKTLDAHSRARIHSGSPNRVANINNTIISSVRHPMDARMDMKNGEACRKHIGDMTRMAIMVWKLSIPEKILDEDV